MEGGDISFLSCHMLLVPFKNFISSTSENRVKVDFEYSNQDCLVVSKDMLCVTLDQKAAELRDLKS